MDDWNLTDREPGENGELNAPEAVSGSAENGNPSTSGYDDPQFDEEPIVITETPVKQEEPKEKKRSSSVGVVIAAIFFIAALGFSGVMGIRTLWLRRSMKTQKIEREIVLEKGTWTKFQAYYATEEVMTYEHSVNFIPTGKEHYFAVWSKDGAQLALLRADKSWYADNFEDGVAKNDDGVTVEGFVRKADYKVSDTLRKDVAELQMSVGRSYRVNYDLYIDAIAVRLSIYEIILMAVPLLVTILVLVFGRGLLKQRLDSTLGKRILIVFVIGMFVYGGFAIHVLSLV